MSESEDVQSVAESEEASDTESSRPRSEADDDKDESEKQEDFVTPRSERPSTPKCDEPEKPNFDCGESQPPKSTSTTDRSKPGECNLLPVLVERLRSALELSCSSQSSEDPLPLEDSGIDSEEDLRIWASGLCHSMNQSDQSPKPLDLKFLEDLLLSDIQSALSRLQETLKRVDINALTKHSSSLDPTNKLCLLRLISNLLSKLKIPDEVGKPEKSNVIQGPTRRRRADRHTIGVSTKELACARKWLEEKNIGANLVEPMSGVGAVRKELVPMFPTLTKVEGTFVKPVQPVQPTVDKQFDQVRDKYAKDDTNRQQSIYDVNQEPTKEDSRVLYDPTIESITTSVNRVDVGYKVDHCPIADEEYSQIAPSSCYHHQSTPSNRYNKFMAKKSKIKRANTIDIPNYLKLQAESFGQNQNGCISLRRPINISDKPLSNNTNIVPSFQPKTESDRKFLALINKNNDSNPNNIGSSFKSFNYKQISTADKHWNSRFSNIKTTFDKPQLDSPDDVTAKRQDQPRRKSQSGTSMDSGEADGIVIGSLRLPYVPPKKKSTFTHAPTSPFQRIEKPSLPNDSTPAFPKPGYLSKAGSTLQAKVKLFDQENVNSQAKPTAPAPPYRVKVYKAAENVSFGRNTLVPGDDRSCELTRDKQFNCNSVYKQFIVPRKSDVKFCGENNAYPASVVSAATSKLIMHIDKNTGSKTVNQPKCPYSDVPTKKDCDKIQSSTSYDDIQSLHQPRQYDNYNRVKMNNLVNIASRKMSDSSQSTTDYEDKSKGNGVKNDYEAIPTRVNFKEKELSRQTSSSSSSSSSYFVKPVVPIDNHAFRDNYSNKNYPLGVVTNNAIADIKSPMNKQRTLSNNKDMKPLNVSSHSVSNPPENYPVLYKSSAEMFPVNNNNKFPNSVSQNCQANNYQKLSESHPMKSQHDSSYASNKDRQTQGYSGSNNIYPDNYLDNQNNYPRATNSTQNFLTAHGVPIQDTRANYTTSSKTSVQSYPNSRYSVENCPEKHGQSQISSKLINYTENPIQTYPPSIYPDKPSARTFEPQLHQPQSHPIKQVSTSSIENIRPTIIDASSEDLSFLEDENIQNQDISSDGVVTRYTCAIATVASDQENPGPSGPDETRSKAQLPSNIKISAYPATQEESNSDIPSITSYSSQFKLEPRLEQKIKPAEIPFDEIQRHNLLQQQLIHKLQNEQQNNVRRRSSEIQRKNDDAQIKPSSILPNKIDALKQSYGAIIESKNTREKISIFEEKTSSPEKQRFKPVNVIPKINNSTRRDFFSTPKINIVNPSKVVQPKFHNKQTPTLKNMRLVDSSDEYLMSCANKPSRSIVLSKSESWHQLALSRSNLQVPQASLSSGSELKPPKPKSPSSLKLSKQYEASSSSDNIKRMEEKIQRYFHSPTNTSGGATETFSTGKRESKSKRHFTSKKTYQTGLARSHTMPHLHDDKSIDEPTDVEKAFDSLFREATRADNPY